MPEHQGSFIQEPPRKKIISPTQVESYLKCGEQYRRRYINREVIPPGIALVKGTAIHKGAAELNFKQKLTTFKDLPKKQLQESAVSAFEDRVKAESLELTAEESARGKSVVVAEAKDSIVGLAGLFRDEIAPLYQPAAVENEQRIVLTKSPRDLLAKCDLVDDQQVIVELKTGSKSFNQARVDGMLQLTFEALTYRAMHKEDPKGIIVEQMVDSKTPVRKKFETVRTKEDYQALINTVNNAITGIEAGHFKPAPAGVWWCSPRFCGYWATCPYVNSTRVAAAEATE